MWIAKLPLNLPPTASRAPLKAKTVEYVSGVSGNDCHGDSAGGALALASWER